ncbi:MAG: O-antigen ligase family protein [Candidatus Omnitrophica bacterium]|nr:O-antigen ligase family protein [Candidatus Omnitrophota bacterium]
MRIKEAAFFVLFPVVFAVAVSISFFEIFSGIFLGLSLLAFFKSKNRSVFKNAFVFFVLVYFLMTLLSIMQSDYWWVSARGAFKVFRQILLCFSVIFILDSEGRLKKIMQWILVVGVLIGVDALVQSWVGFDFLRGRTMTPLLADVGRLTGPFRHANDFSTYLVVLFMLFLVFSAAPLRSHSFKRRLFYLIGLALTAYCLLRTYSRGAWMALIGTWLMMVFIRKSRFLALGLLVLLSWGAFFAPPLMKMRLAGFSERHSGTLIERLELWGESARMIKQNPWFGLGVNTYAKNEPRYKSGKPNIDNQYAHNGYLQMAAEIGILGLASFLVFLLVFFVGTLPVFMNSPDHFLKTAGIGLVSGILAFLLHALMETNLHSLLLVNWFWLLLGVTWAVRNQILREKTAG